MHAGYFPDTTFKLIAARKATVLVNRDEHGFYASCPELKGCQSQGLTHEEVMANIRKPLSSTSRRYQTLSIDERYTLLNREILTTMVELSA
jgi:hypothetical protein